MSARQFLFAKRKDEWDRTLPFTRWDIILSVILGITMMAAVAYSAEMHGGWSLKRGVVVGSIATLAVCASQNRRVVLGCAFALIAFRMMFGLLTGTHPFIFSASIVVSAGAAYLLLQDLN
jgi:amino acid transporter